MKMKGVKGKVVDKGTGMVAPKGGEPKIAIPGKAVMQEAKSGKTGGFKKGGKVEGCAPMDRMDKVPRKASGGGVNNRGRSPFSTAGTSIHAAKSGGKSGGYY